MTTSTIKDVSQIDVRGGMLHDMKVDNASATEFSDKDERELAAMGKRQVLRRNFGFWSILGLSLSCTVTWEGLLAVFVTGLTDGGPAGLVYGFIFCWAGYMAIIASMAELASMVPTAGGQYHWVYLLAPPAWKNFFSYITGWQSVIAWQATAASASYLGGTMVQGLIVLNYPDYNYQLWHGTMLFYAVLLLAVVFNTALARYLPQVEFVILAIHIGGFIGILVPLVYFAPHGTASDVFGQFLTGGGYESRGLTFFVGIVSSVFAFVGADGAVHMCEEIGNASTVVPWTMVGSIAINGTLGFGMLVAVLFCIGNVDNALKTPTLYPFIEIFTQATNSISSATAMASFVIALIVCATISLFAATSRLTWAFARDLGIPGSRWIGKVDPRTKLPLVSIALTTVISFLLALINIGSSAAFNAMISLVVSGFLGSYILPVVLLMYRRFTDPQSLKMGPWSLGRAALPINIFALIWTVIAMFFSFWPTAIPVTAATMNWSCLLYGFTIAFALLFYVLHGRYTYKGPVIETGIVEHLA